MVQNNTELAKFRFERYLVTETKVNVTGKEIDKDIHIGVEPEGEINSDNKLFTLTLRVVIRDATDNLEVGMVIKGFFSYEMGSIEELLPYISVNAPAILFPYIRSYISSMTALGGMPPIILPTLNLTRVGEKLRETFEGESLKS